MEQQIKYQTEIKTATMGGRTITIRNLTPILSPEERERRRREIEICLYNIFIKYEKNKQKTE